jgi:hypothetical protein
VHSLVIAQNNKRWTIQRIKIFDITSLFLQSREEWCCLWSYVVRCWTATFTVTWRVMSVKLCCVRCWTATFQESGLSPKRQQLLSSPKNLEMLAKPYRGLRVQSGRPRQCCCNSTNLWPCIPNWMKCPGRESTRREASGRVGTALSASPEETLAARNATLGTAGRHRAGKQHILLPINHVTTGKREIPYC